MAIILANTTMPDHAKANTNPDKQWDLIKTDQDNDITVYYRQLDSGNIEFIGITRTTTSISSIVALFLDLNTMPQWLYRTQQVTLLKRVKDDELYVHMVHSMPFPFRNRDSVDHILVSQAPTTKTLTINIENTPNYIDTIEDFVRVPIAFSQWQISPLADGQIEITFRGYGEPGGSISTQTYRSMLFQWLVKQFLWQVPYETLRNLREYLRQEKYQNRTFNFVLEPNGP